MYSFVYNAVLDIVSPAGHSLLTNTGKIDLWVKG